ncbi:MAG: hypothetical protein ACR2OZ_01110 [Verrucomicrobiales bacterium]
MNRLPSVMPFLGGALVGAVLAGGFAFYWHNRNITGLRSEWRRAEASVARLNAELTHAKQRQEAAPDAGDVKTDGRPSKKRSTLTFSQGGGVTTPEDLDTVKAEATKRLTEKRQRRIDEKIAAIRSRLNLSDEQAAKLRGVYEANVPNAAELFVKFLTASENGGEGAEDLVAELSKAAQIESSGSPQLDGQIRDLLTSEQQTAYADYRQEQRTNQIEITASKELTKLQGMMTLRPEQKDTAFGILSELASNEIDAPSASLSDPEAMTKRHAARSAAFQGVLTPEQLAIYQNSSSSFMDMAAPFMDLFDVFDPQTFSDEKEDDAEPEKPDAR